MLHTDAFNKSNKRKMTKADYIKNTQLPGIDPEVLEVRGKVASLLLR
jgi:Sec7-like guanine-nucleotide exchange factor